MRFDLTRLLYAVTVFWSAVLLLILQPILTKAILPWFGGSAGVWTSSMLFYQLLLLLGYLYAHVIARRLPVRQQVVLHLTLIAVSLVLLPIHPAQNWKPHSTEDPLPRILGLLFTTAGLPYFLLSTTSPLLQSWFSLRFREELPYRLFAVSNLGSLVALLIYPFAIEPLLSTDTQLSWWSFGFCGFALTCSAAAWPGLRVREADLRPITPIWSSVWPWFALSACASALWLAVANHLSQDVAAIPFLWVLPLGLYLLSFVLCFDNEGWYRPKLYRWLLPVAWAGITVGVAQTGLVNIKWTVLIFAASLFVCCMFCHGELARLKPDTRELTAYYLTIAAGGAAGGIFVGLIAPRVFNEFLELPIALLGCVMLACAMLYRFPMKRVMRLGITAGLATVAAVLTRSQSLTHAINTRNFYGTLQVGDAGSMPNTYRSLVNGTIHHGLQFLSADLSRIPTTYYGPASGAAIAISSLRNGPMRVGVIGLGVGTMAAYGKPGDLYRFYEINPVVIDFARSEFRYLRESKAATEVVPGDARLSLEREPPQNYDVLIVDAFSGDSIPIHLLTREVFELYFRHVKSTGAIAVHVTNRHLDLAPVVKAIAEVSDASALLIHNSKEDSRKIYSSSWVIVTRNQDLAREIGYLASPIKKRSVLWTDNYSNLLTSLR